MKCFMAMLVLTVSMGAFAQERKVLDSEEVSVKGSSAVLVRTANTPDKVTVTFQVPMANSFCADPRTEYVRRTCFRNESVYQTRQVCRDVVVTVPGTTPRPSNDPRGPRYNPTPQTRTERRCTNETVVVGTRSVPYDCSYSRNWCAGYGTNVATQPDEVKIKFKNMPALGGSEEETFMVTAKQRQEDGSNVTYDIDPVTTSPGHEYEVKSKGILGYDSYVIQPK